MTTPTKHPYNPPTNSVTLTRIVPAGFRDLAYQISCWEQRFREAGRMEGDDYADPDNGIYSYPYVLAKGEYATKHNRTLYLLRAEGYFANNVQESERSWVLRTNAGQWTVQAFRSVAENDGWYRHTVAQIMARDGWNNSQVYDALHIPRPGKVKEEEKSTVTVTVEELDKARADAVREFARKLAGGSLSESALDEFVADKAHAYADAVERGEK